jgi:SAM-dependent methyltransferase
MAEIAAVEDAHWWFRGRRTVVARVLEQLRLPPDARLLEAGCGSGGNLALLARYGRLRAFEPDAEMRAWAEARGGVPVADGRLPGGVPFEDERFDAILLLDVLEHVEEDRASLAALGARLAPGGRLVVTVPAYRWLWSAHDDANHHVRRYTRGGLVRTAAAAGLRVVRATYYNTLLFPAAVGARLAGRLVGSAGSSGLGVLPPPVNRLLAGVFGAERHLVGRVPLPFGVSVLMVAERAA